MISSKLLASTALLAAVVGSIGLAYAQTAVPTPDSARVEPNKGTMQPGTNGTTTTTPGSAGSTTATGTTGTTGMTPGTPSTTSTTSGTVRAPATPMSADAPMRDQNGNLRSDSMNNNMNNNMNRNMNNNSGTDTSSGMAPARTERVARADRN